MTSNRGSTILETTGFTLTIRLRLIYIKMRPTSTSLLLRLPKITLPELLFNKLTIQITQKLPSHQCSKVKKNTSSLKLETIWITISSATILVLLLSLMIDQLMLSSDHHLKNHLLTSLLLLPLNWMHTSVTKKPFQRRKRFLSSFNEIHIHLLIK